MLKNKHFIHIEYPFLRDPNAWLGIDRDQNQLVLTSLQDAEKDKDLILEVESLAVGTVEGIRGNSVPLAIDDKEFMTPSKLDDLDNRLLLKPVKKRDEECLSEWVLGKMEEFGSFLGLSCEGLETEIVGLFRLIDRERRKGEGNLEIRSVECKLLRKELKKREVNYDRNGGCVSEGGGRKGKGISRK